MIPPDEESSVSYMHPFSALILVLLCVGVGFVLVGPMIGVLLSMAFYDGSIMDLMEAIQNPIGHDDIKIPMYIIQGAATFFGLIITPFVLLRAFKRKASVFFSDQRFYLPTLVIVPLVVFSFMGVNSAFIQWNADFHFPEFMKPVEEWAREKEDLATELTMYMTDFKSITELVIALVVIAILPAIGEELVFRGLIQNEMKRLTKNIHVAIWVSAIIFSAFHLQFFGFVPRLLLGALFGYLYYWSGNLVMAMLAHFVNNGVAVVGLYFYRQGALDYNVESTDALPLSFILASAVITFVLLFYYRNFYRTQRSIEVN